MSLSFSPTHPVPRFKKLLRKQSSVTSAAGTVYTVVLCEIEKQGALCLAVIKSMFNIVQHMFNWAHLCCRELRRGLPSKGRALAKVEVLPGYLACVES